MTDDLSSHYTDADGIEASAFSPVAVRETARAHIQAEIASSEAVTRLWKRRLNALTVVSRLPPELLGVIFRHVAGAETPKYAKFRWISVSHVCWHWRRVALDCPDLWSNIPFTRPALAAEMVRRSKSAPLTIAVAFGENYESGVVRELDGQAVQTVLGQVLTQMSRVKELSLSNTAQWARYMFAELIALMDAPAPLLEKLDIAFLSKDSQNRLPDSLVAGSPRLLHLKLVRCGMKWQGLALSNLKTLRITHTPDTLSPSVDELLAALSRMPSLEVLEICSTFAPSDTRHIPPATVATLPCLRLLHVECALSDCVSLLGPLTYSKKARVHIKCGVSSSEQNSPNNFALIRRLSEELISGMEGRIELLAVDRSRIGCWRSYKTGPAGKRPNPPMFDVTIDFSAALIEEFVNSLPLNHLASLVVLRAHLNEATWSKLGDLSRLMRLRIGPGENEVALLNTLSYGTSDSAEELTTDSQPVAGATPKFRALRSLTMNDWTFDDFFDDFGTSLFGKLSDCLEARREAGLQLHYLGVKDCRHVTDDDIECLEADVKSVVWDGEGNFTEEEYSDAYSVTYSDLDVY